MRPPSRVGDRLFAGFTFLMAGTVVVLICLVGWQLWSGSRLSIQHFGWRFLASSAWDPVNDDYGALPFIFGTLVSSLIALLIAVPLSVATAIYLTELAPLWLRQPVVSLIEMLAAIPSVILGLWGIFVMVPWMRVTFLPVLRHYLGWCPLFQGRIYGDCILAGGMIIAIMIIPIITSVSREILISVPHLQREAAYALGATRWEVTRIAVLSYAKRGIFVMVPWLRVYILPFLGHLFGWCPLFQGSTNGLCMLAGGMIIAIMIIPIITSVSREILASVPHLQREAAYALGATRWEVTRIAVLSYARRGIFGAIVLGLGRALGETMAVTMVIGNTPQIAASLFAPGSTLASVIANEFSEAGDLYAQSLFEIGLVLFLVTIAVNLLAQIVLRTFGGATVKQ